MIIKSNIKTSANADAFKAFFNLSAKKWLQITGRINSGPHNLHVKRLIQQAGLDRWVNEAFNNVNESTLAIKAPKRKSSSWSSRANQ